MSARTLLNEAYFQGAVVVPAVVGLLFGSWLVFFVALGILVTFNLHTGAIRLRLPPPSERGPAGASRWRHRRPPGPRHLKG